MAKLRPAEDTLAFAVAETLDTLALAPEDRGVAVLAALYATLIDELPAALPDIGPKLLACLEALGASPRARAAISKGGPTGGSGKLARLREARAD